LNVRLIYQGNHPIPETRSCIKNVVHWHKRIVTDRYL
jgi:hypothetical protein